MTFVPRQEKKNCFIACNEDKVNSGLCDCINIMRNETLSQPIISNLLLDEKTNTESYNDSNTLLTTVKFKEMTREQKLETIVKLFAKTMFYGNWKWETPNERVIEMLMREVDLYPFPNEDAMIFSTKVDEELYKRALTEVPTRQVVSQNTEKCNEKQLD